MELGAGSWELGAKFQQNTKHDSALQVATGVAAIAEVIGETKRRAQWLHTDGQLPTFMLGGRVCMTTRAWRQLLEAREAEALARVGVT